MNTIWSSQRKGERTFVPFTVLLALLFLCILPVAALVWIAINTGSTSDVWQHLLKYVIPPSLLDTALLLGFVTIGTTLLGAGTAWLTTLYDFPGRKIFSWALVLPLAVPSYIAAYTFVEFLDYTGPVQVGYRSLLEFIGVGKLSFPDIRSTWGAGLIFSVVLYPYVYLACRLVFSMQGASVLDASRSLGAGQWELLWRIGLPMARPALVAGVALALMETLNDIGAVEILGVRTLTYAVFETWLNRSSLGGAVQLALITLVLIALLIALERRSRSGRSYANTSRERPPGLIVLSRLKQVICMIGCVIPLTAGLGIPIWILGTYALRRVSQWFDPDLLNAAANSLILSLLTAGLATLIAYGILQYARVGKSSGFRFVSRVGSLGYAIPGTVLAIGLLVPLAAFDNLIDGLLRSWWDVSTGLLLSGTLAIVVYACTLRFLAIAIGTIESAFSRLSPHVDMVAGGLGRTRLQIAFEVHRPILTPALAGAFLLVFVDTMKELSATLLLRPFDFQTLATFVYDLASQDALENAAFACLLIIMIGFIPMIILNRMAETVQKKTRT